MPATLTAAADEAMPPPAPNGRPWPRALRDPMPAALLASVLVHALLILGVGFRMPEPPPLTRTLEVMVITEDGQTPPVPNPNAVAAQYARVGETLVALPDEEPAMTEVAAVPTTELMPLTPLLPTVPPPEESDPVAGPDPDLPPPTPEPLPPEPPLTEPLEPPPPDLLALDAPASRRLDAPSLLASRDQEIAALTERIQSHGSSRVRRRAISTATREFKYATYMEGWRRKVENIGNLNYPPEAKRLGLYGHLILSVAVRADGSLESVRVLRSSGHDVLDQAAVKIVELAAPFAPFPPDIRAETDVLDITRTWQFQRNHRLEWGR